MQNDSINHTSEHWRQTAAFTSLCLKQGREDAEMLAEKKEHPMPTPKDATSMKVYPADLPKNA